MAAIEKVCEFTKDGHWYVHCDKDPFLPYDKNGNSIYRDNLQVCLDHRVDLREMFKGKSHEIVIVRGESKYCTPKYTWYFYLYVDGVPCPFEDSPLWMNGILLMQKYID